MREEVIKELELITDEEKRVFIWRKSRRWYGTFIHQKINSKWTQRD